jgi:hypothetical protein
MKTKYLFTLIAILMLVGGAAAETVNMTATRGALFKGAVRLIDLGIDYLVPSATANMYYNFISICIIFLVAALSSSRNSRFFAILLPVMGAMFVWFEWLAGSNPVQTWGIITLCAIFGVAYYMKDSLRERFGSGGSGTLILNLMIFLILFQTVIGVINITGVWGTDNTIPTPKDYQYGNVKLEATVTSTANTGGLFSDITSAANLLGNMMVSGLRMFLELLKSIGMFSLVIATAYPWMVTMPDGSANVVGIAALGVIQVGIWLIYTKFIFDLFFKPGLGTADF